MTIPLAGADIIKLSKSIDTTGTSVLPPKSYVAPFADPNISNGLCDIAFVAVS